MGRSSTLIAAIAVVAASCGNGNSGPMPSATSTSPAPLTTTELVITSTTPPAPPTTAPIEDDDIEALSWGLLCHDLSDAGYSYPGAVAYWKAEGRPARMDSDANGIPCETVYPGSDVTAYWGDPLPTGLEPGPGSGWRASDRVPATTPGCCSMNSNGPVSPPLPTAAGEMLADGAYAVRAKREEGRADRLELEIRRWLPCSGSADHCSPDLFAGDVYADPDGALTRTVSLDKQLLVVVRPIGRFVGGTWALDSSIEGDGSALGALLHRMDAATTRVADRADSAGELQPDLVDIGTADPTFPYGAPPWGDFGSFLAYRGPEGSYLTPGLYAVLDSDEPDWMYGWWCTLEVVDRSPVLYIWAGQIAG